MHIQKVKQSLNRPGVVQRVPRGLGSQISMTVRLSASRTGRPYPQEIFLILIFTRGWVDPRVMVRSEGNVSLKNPVTPPGIDPGTVRLVAHCLHHYANPGPIKYIYILFYYYWYSALGPVWAETRVQSGDWYGSGTLHPGQVLKGSLPLLSPAFFRRSHFSPPGAFTSATT